MRNKIVGGIGIVWGGALLVRWLMVDAPVAGSAAYQSGQSGAVLIGTVMLAAGLYYFFNKLPDNFQLRRRLSPPTSRKKMRPRVLFREPR